jgi:hypothetical protein
MGIKDYSVGNHPLWEIFRTVRQMSSPPLGMGGLALGTGYFWAMLRREKRPVSQELISFHRREQMHRLKKFFAIGTSRAPVDLKQPVEPQVGPR